MIGVQKNLRSGGSQEAALSRTRIKNIFNLRDPSSFLLVTSSPLIASAGNPRCTVANLPHLQC